MLEHTDHPLGTLLVFIIRLFHVLIIVHTDCLLQPWRTQLKERAGPTRVNTGEVVTMIGEIQNGTSVGVWAATLDITVNTVS